MYGKDGLPFATTIETSKADVIFVRRLALRLMNYARNPPAARSRLGGDPELEDSHDASDERMRVTNAFCGRRVRAAPSVPNETAERRTLFAAFERFGDHPLVLTRPAAERSRVGKQSCRYSQIVGKRNGCMPTYRIVGMGEVIVEEAIGANVAIMASRLATARGG